MSRPRHRNPRKYPPGSDLAKLIALVEARGWTFHFPDDPLDVRFEHGGGVVIYWEGDAEKHPRLLSKTRWFDRKGKESKREVLVAQELAEQKSKADRPDNDDDVDWDEADND